MRRNPGPKMSGNSGPKMSGNSGPKMGQNSGPKMGQNSGPKMGKNSGPKLARNEGAGPGRQGTQKFACNFYRNTENGEKNQNTERVSNKEFILNVERTITFKSNDDILHLLKTHPDFERIPPDSLQPIIAGILAGLMGAIGTVLLVVAPGASTGMVLLIKILASAASSGGLAGVENALKHGINGTFTWTEWTADIAISATSSLITLGCSTLSVWGTTTSLMLNATELSSEFLQNVMRTAKLTSTLIGSITSAATEAVKKVIKDEKIDPTMLMLAFITGGLQGYEIGSTVSEKVILDRLTNLHQNAEQLCENYKQFWTSQRDFWRHVEKYATKIDINSPQINGVSFNFHDAAGSTVLSDSIFEKLAEMENGFLPKLGKQSWTKAYLDQNRGILCLANLDDKIIAAHKAAKHPVKAIIKFEDKRTYLAINKEGMDMLVQILGKALKAMGGQS